MHDCSLNYYFIVLFFFFLRLPIPVFIHFSHLCCHVCRLDRLCDISSVHFPLFITSLITSFLIMSSLDFRSSIQLYFYIIFTTKRCFHFEVYLHDFIFYFEAVVQSGLGLPRQQVGSSLPSVVHSNLPSPIGAFPAASPYHSEYSK